MKRQCLTCFNFYPSICSDKRIGNVFMFYLSLDLHNCILNCFLQFSQHQFLYVMICLKCGGLVCSRVVHSLHRLHSMAAHIPFCPIPWIGAWVLGAMGFMGQWLLLKSHIPLLWLLCCFSLRAHVRQQILHRISKTFAFFTVL